MEVFRELRVQGVVNKIDEFLTRVETELPAGWARAAALEQRLMSDDEVRCFTCAPTTNRAAASLWLVQKTPTEWYVSNIVPADKPSLSIDEYNQILEEFDSLLAPFASNVHVETTAAEVSLEDLVQDIAVRHALRSFSAAANRSTGARHPADRQRWFEFVRLSFKNRVWLGSEMLSRILNEEEGWSEDQALHLGDEYARLHAFLAHVRDHGGF